MLMGGYLGNTDQWNAFNSDWQSLLKAECMERRVLNIATVKIYITLRNSSKAGPVKDATAFV
jgi:hypothetical protein